LPTQGEEGRLQWDIIQLVRVNKEKWPELFEDIAWIKIMNLYVHQPQTTPWKTGQFSVIR
jgi:hypothetical protein